MFCACYYAQQINAYIKIEYGAFLRGCLVNVIYMVRL